MMHYDDNDIFKDIYERANIAGEAPRGIVTLKVNRAPDDVIGAPGREGHEPDFPTSPEPISSYIYRFAARSFGDVIGDPYALDLKQDDGSPQTARIGVHIGVNFDPPTLDHDGVVFLAVPLNEKLLNFFATKQERDTMSDLHSGGIAQLENELAHYISSRWDSITRDTTLGDSATFSGARVHVMQTNPYVPTNKYVLLRP